MDLQRIYERAPGWLRTLGLNTYAWKIERHRYGAPYRRKVAELLEQERWAPERMRAYQDARVREVVARAYQGSEFYRERMDASGVRPTDVRGVDDLRRLPLLHKDDVRRAGSRMTTASAPRRGWLHGHTSGTTGTPLGLWYDRATCILNNAVDRRQKIWAGMGEGDWVGLFLGRLVVPPRRSQPPFWVANHVQRQLWFSSFHLSDDRLPAYVAEIRARRLRFLEGYPSTLFIVARHLLERGQRLPMKAVLTSSETLHDTQRDAIEAAFECRIFDFYGHAERAIFASECEAHQGKHVAEEYGFVEIVDGMGEPVPDGEAGFLVGTSLHNVAQPMIRYRTSDISRILTAPCSCGRTLRRIDSVTTKAEDIVVTPDGRMISPSILTHPFKPLDGLVKSQVVQETVDRLRVRLVVGGGFTADDERGLIAALRERLGPDMNIEVELVEDIPAEASGKFRWVVSRVDHSRRIDWSAAAAGGEPT
jgi:phenylacetate-CoA ligase